MFWDFFPVLGVLLRLFSPLFFPDTAALHFIVGRPRNPPGWILVSEWDHKTKVARTGDERTRIVYDEQVYKRVTWKEPPSTNFCVQAGWQGKRRRTNVVTLAGYTGAGAVRSCLGGP